jgi:hypothetical protein
MADTGEKRQISARANAKEAEKVRSSKKMVSEERSTVKARNAAFGGTKKGSPPKGTEQRSSKPRT